MPGGAGWRWAFGVGLLSLLSACRAGLRRWAFAVELLASFLLLAGVWLPVMGVLGRKRQGQKSRDDMCVLRCAFGVFAFWCFGVSRFGVLAFWRLAFGVGLLALSCWRWGYLVWARLCV